jgi:hypothetical protein
LFSEFREDVQAKQFVRKEDNVFIVSEDFLPFVTRRELKQRHASYKEQVSVLKDTKCSQFLLQFKKFLGRIYHLIYRCYLFIYLGRNGELEVTSYLANQKIIGSLKSPGECSRCSFVCSDIAKYCSRCGAERAPTLPKSTLFITLTTGDLA